MKVDLIHRGEKDNSYNLSNKIIPILVLNGGNIYHLSKSKMIYYYHFPSIV